MKCWCREFRWASFIAIWNRGSEARCRGQTRLSGESDLSCRGGGFHVDVGNGGDTHDLCILATDWRRITDILPESIREVAGIASLGRDRIGPHHWPSLVVRSANYALAADAVLPGRRSQWMFNRGEQQITSEMNNTTSRITIRLLSDASRHLADQPKDEIASAQVVGELAAVWPAVRKAKVIQAHTVTQQHAVFSVQPGFDRLRPSQKSSIPNLFLAGDWTQTDWPSTMEGAVRQRLFGGRAGARISGETDETVVPDLRRSWLVRLVPGLNPAQLFNHSSRNFASRSEQAIAVSRKCHKSFTDDGRRKIVPAVAPIFRANVLLRTSRSTSAGSSCSTGSKLPAPPRNAVSRGGILGRRPLFPCRRRLLDAAGRTVFVRRFGRHAIHRQITGQRVSRPASSIDWIKIEIDCQSLA